MMVGLVLRPMHCTALRPSSFWHLARLDLDAMQIKSKVIITLPLPLPILTIDLPYY
jgi:hypothetical protein